MIYINFILGQLYIFLLVIIGGIIHPFILYPKREKIWAMRLLPKNKRAWYWKFSDTSEINWGSDRLNYLQSMYGIYELVRKLDENGAWVPDYDKFNTFGKFKLWLLSWWWQVARNGAYNAILERRPPELVGDDYNCKVSTGGYDCSLWRNLKYHGKQSLTYPKEKPTHFRYSFTKKASWYNVHRLLASLFTLKWHTHFNFMAGYGETRALLKMRSFIESEVRKNLNSKKSLSLSEQARLRRNPEDH